MMDDLFAMLDAPAAQALRKEEAEQINANPAVVDVDLETENSDGEIERTTYRIRRITDRDDEDRYGSTENPRPIWRLFVLDKMKREHRLFLIGRDADTIPKEVLYRAEQILPWSEGGMDRARAIAKLHEPPRVPDEEWA